MPDDLTANSSRLGVIYDPNDALVSAIHRHLKKDQDKITNIDKPVFLAITVGSLETELTAGAVSFFFDGWLNIETIWVQADPLFVDEVKDVVGLYLNPPGRAAVLCVDEKTQIQALERSRPVLPL